MIETCCMHGHVDLATLIDRPDLAKMGGVFFGALFFFFGARFFFLWVAGVG